MNIRQTYHALFAPALKERGSAAVEFAMVVPFLLLLFAGAFEGGRLFYDYHVLTKAVRDGARFDASLPATCSGLKFKADIERVQQLTRTGTIDGSGDPVLPGWTDNTTVDVSGTCFDNSSDTYSGLYDDVDQIPVITVRAAINRNYMFAGLIFDDATATLGARNQQVSIGE